jgi:hypothetical protein
MSGKSFKNYHDQFPDMPVNEPVVLDQVDHMYLAAIDELCRVQGIRNILECAKFTARVFDKSLSAVMIDAAAQSAVAGKVFGKEPVTA